MHSSVDGQPLPSDAEVFRLFKLSKDKQISEEFFQLSSADKATRRKLLSVWERTRTTVEEALGFVQANAGSYQKYAFLR